MTPSPFKGFALSYLVCALIFAVSSSLAKLYLAKDSKPSMSIILLSGAVGAIAVYLAIKIFPSILKL